MKETIDVAKPDGTVFDDIDFEPIETSIPDNIETINIKDDIDIPSDDSIAIDAPKKVEIITNPNRLWIASNKIKKKYTPQKPKGISKKANKKAADWLRRVGYVDTDDLETIDYNNDTNVNGLKDTNTNNIDNINLKKTSGAQITAKKIVKKYRNLARKKTYQRLLPPSENNFNDFTDLETVDYNNDTSISDLNDIASGPKKNKNAQIAAKKIVQKYKKLAKKKAPVPFNINDVADAETIDYNKDTNINDVFSSKSAQIAAKK